MRGISQRPKVLIADDHALVAEGIARLLTADYEVVGIVTDGRRLVEQASALRPDVVVLDIGMPGLNGIDAAAQIRRQHAAAKLVFVTQQVDRPYLRAALRVGALGYVIKQSAPGELLVALRRALQGKLYVSPSLSDELLQLSREAEASERPGDDLTPRQREVLQMVAEGKTVKEISAVLNISPKTVEFHKHNIMDVLGMHTTAELTRYALARGIVAS